MVEDFAEKIPDSFDLDQDISLNPCSGTTRPDSHAAQPLVPQRCLLAHYDRRPRQHLSAVLAERILQTARAYKEQTVAEAIGQTARFLKAYEEYNKAPEVMRSDSGI